MGDGLLAIFREEGPGPQRAVAAACEAAKAGLAALRQANGEGRFPCLVEAGIAVHRGSVAYGNVGSGARLDFTVVGKDVNLASRVAELNRATGEPLLMTGAVARLAAHPLDEVGAFEVKGFADPVTVYRPGGEGR